MKQVRLLNCCAAALLIAGSSMAVADTYKPPQVLPVLDQSGGDRSFCLDSMETVPFSDELEPIPVTVDGGCLLSETAILT
jgi:hypothetical protein